MLSYENHALDAWFGKNYIVEQERILEKDKKKRELNDGNVPCLPLSGEVDFAAGKRRRGSYRYLSLSQNLRFGQLPRQREPFQRD